MSKIINLGDSATFYPFAIQMDSVVLKAYFLVAGLGTSKLHDNCGVTRIRPTPRLLTKAEAHERAEMNESQARKRGHMVEVNPIRHLELKS